MKTPKMDTARVSNHGGRTLWGIIVRVGVPAAAAMIVILLALGLVQALAIPRIADAGPSASQGAVPAETRQKLAKVQMPFVANQGQGDKAVKFYARTFAGTVAVTAAGELVYSLPKLEGKERVKGVALTEELIGGKVTEVTGESQAVTKLSYFKGNDRSKWQSNIPTYNTVSLGEVYEGIEAKLKAYGNNVEKLFHVKPGAEPETIKIRLSGGKGIKVNQSGELEVETEQGTVRFSKPVAFQEGEERKQFVAAAYVVRGHEYGFTLGDYDRTRELVIDPILAATFLGGSEDDAVLALALDAAGNVYVAGSTTSSDFPGVGPGSADSTFAGREGFVAKLNANLSTILAATFLGGTGRTLPLALTLDRTGNVYIAGVTSSPDFPGIGPGSADHTFAAGDSGLDEGFVAKVNADLSAILAATFLGGSGGEELIFAVALDRTGNVYVTGFTGSSDFPGIGPGSAIPDRDARPGEREGIVAKLNADLSTILAATFLGGGEGQSQALALDSGGNVYVAGSFMAKLNADLSSILAVTPLGNGFALGLDSTGNVYVAGLTNGGIPGVGPGSADSTVASGEGFVAKLDANLSSEGFVVVNNLVTFDPLPSTFTFTPDPTGCPAGFVGTFSFEARLTNASGHTLSDLFIEVTILTNGNLLQNADGGPGSVGAQLTVPQQDGFSDGVLSSEEFVEVPFVICLTARAPFNFVVDVLGNVD